MGDRPGHPFRGNQWGRGGVSVSRGDYRVREEDAPYDRQVVEGRFLNKGKVAVRYGSGQSDTTNYHATAEEAHAEADKVLRERAVSQASGERDKKLIAGALVRGVSPEAEDALARTLGGRTPRTSQIAGFIRKQYGTTYEEAERHARRITGSRDAFIDSSGTSRAKVSAVIEYMRTRGKEIKRK